MSRKYTISRLVFIVIESPLFFNIVTSSSVFISTSITDTLLNIPTPSSLKVPCSVLQWLPSIGLANMCQPAHTPLLHRSSPLIHWNHPRHLFENMVHHQWIVMFSLITWRWRFHHLYISFPNSIPLITKLMSKSPGYRI